MIITVFYCYDVGPGVVPQSQLDLLRPTNHTEKQSLVSFL